MVVIYINIYNTIDCFGLAVCEWEWENIKVFGKMFRNNKVTWYQFTHCAPFTAVRGAFEKISHKCEEVNVELCEGKFYSGTEG